MDRYFWLDAQCQGLAIRQYGKDYDQLNEECRSLVYGQAEQDFYDMQADMMEMRHNSRLDAQMESEQC